MGRHIIVDFSLTDEQRKLYEETVAFGRDQLNHELVERERDRIFERSLWHSCAQQGILGFGVPREYSGSEQRDMLTCVVAMEGLGYGCTDNGLPFSINAHNCTVNSILCHGTDEQKRRFLPSLVDGTWIASQAITEPETGSDVSAISTHAEKVADGYRLSGGKYMISLAQVADVFMVFATTNPSIGKWGLSVFLIERDSPGLKVSEPTCKMGLNTVPMGAVILERCFVSDSNRLGPEGAGGGISNHSLEYERCTILASQLGRMQRQLEDCIAYVKSREQFSRPISEFQSVSNRIADMRVRLETARLLLYKTAWMKDNGKPVTLEAAMLKLYLSEQFLASGIDAMRLLGGHGYLTENNMERDVRDALGGVLYAGTSDIQRNIIAGMLGL